MKHDEIAPGKGRVPRNELTEPLTMEGFWPLPSPLVVHAESIGAVFAATFGEFAGEVHMPVFDPARSHRLNPPVVAAVGFGDSLDWGYTRLFSNEAPRHCEINALGFSIEPSVGGVKLDDTNRDVATWVDTAMIWLEAMSNQTLTTEKSTRTIYVGGTIHYTDGQNWAPGDAAIRPTSAGDTVDAIRTAGLRCAFDCASQGEQVPIEWRLFLRGRKARASGDPRAAIIEAAVAVEQALSRALHKVAATESSGAAFELLSKQLERMTIGPQVDHVRSLGLFEIPQRTRVDLVQMRNQVVHKGYEPTAVDAEGALSVASEILTDSVPLFAGHPGLIEPYSTVLKEPI